MENPFSAVAIAATAEVIVDTKEQVSYQTTKAVRRSSTGLWKRMTSWESQLYTAWSTC